MNRKMIWNDGLDSWTEEELLCMKYLNVCYGKGGGSAPPPPPSSVQQSTTAEFPTELRPFISDIFEKGQAIQEQRQEEGFQPELTQQLASFTPEQEASFQGIQNVVGQSQPLFNEATTLARQSGRAATDPAEVAALMNPFLRNVTDIQKREAQRVGDVQEQQLAAQASQAGAFGGSRAAILEAERQRNLSQQLGDIEAQGLAASFQNAQNQLQNQFGRESASAAQLGALGAAIPAQQFKEFGALSGIGAAKQQQAQRAFDIATQQAREEYGFPMATLQDFSSILRGFPLPATQNVSRQSFSPAQPLSTQLLGLGTGLAGLAGAAGAFKKAGGLVGAPVGMKNGGYIKLAGGGGLGQMMQEKLPSNRVRMGKTAYQDVTVPIPRGTLFEMSEEIQDILDDEGPAGLAKIQKNYPRNVINFALEQYQQNLPAGNSLKNLLNESNQLITDTDRVLGTPRVAGEIATAAAEKASVPDSAAIPVADPSVFKNPNNLSFLQKAFSVADDIAQGMPTGSPVEVALGQSAPAIPVPKMATKIDSRVPFIQASLNSDGTVAAPPAALKTRGLPAAPALVSAPQMAEEIVGSGPQGMMAEEIVTSPAVPSISGLNPRTGTPPLPSFMAEEIVGSGPQGMMAEEIVTGAPPLPQLANPNRLAPGNSPVVPPPSFLDSLMSDRDKRAAEVEGSFTDIFSEKEGATYGLEPENRSSLEEFLKGTPQNRNFLQRFMAENLYSPLDSRPAGDVVAGGIDDVVNVSQRVGDIAKSAFSGPASAVRDSADYYSNLLSSGPDADVLKERERLEKLTSIDAGSLPPMPQVTGDVGGSEPGTTVPKLVSAAPPAATDPAAPPAGPAAPSAGPAAPTAAPQIDYNAKIAEFNDKDYSKEVKAALGPAPTYEKGEEPDFASNKWLALANFGAGIMASGGGKTLVQSIGEAAKPALKELTAIGKEERKIKGALRTERNTQKRADYQDRAARLKLQRELRGDDIDHTRAMADIADKKARRIVDNKTLAERARANTALINKQIIETATAKYTLDNAKTGRTTSGQAQKAIQDTIQQTRNTIIKNRQFGLNTNAVEEARQIMDAARQTAALYAPTTVKEVKGKDGKTRLEKVDLTKFIPNLGAAPAGGGGGRTLQRSDGSSVKLN